MGLGLETKMIRNVGKVMFAALTVAVVASASTSVYAGSIERMTHASNRNKCKAAVAPKNLKGDAYKAEMAKCAEQGDAYK
jgi:hypothetical protein